MLENNSYFKGQIFQNLLELGDWEFFPSIGIKVSISSHIQYNIYGTLKL